MKNVKQYPLLMVLMLAASCNEKISPAIQNANSVGGTFVPPTPVVTDYYFSVENSSPTILNYKMHRTGPNNYNTDCKVKSTGVNLSSDLYIQEGNASSPVIPHDDKVFDISCFMEAEELSLAMNGFKFDVKASPNTCEYIGYAPYSFYDRIPGDSTTTYTKVVCDEDVSAARAQGYLSTNQAVLIAEGTPVGYGASSVATCNDLIDSTLIQSERQVQRVSSEDDLCRFDYSSSAVAGKQEAGQNCDIGTVTIKEVLISVDPDDPAQVIHTTSTVTKRCGGRISACIQGPIKLEADLAGSTHGSVIVEATQDVAFSKTYIFPGNINKRTTSMEYANYRGQMGALEINYVSYIDAIFGSIWTTDPARKQYDPNIMDYYANNKYAQRAGLDLVLPATITAANKANGYVAKPYAADPFIGLYNYNTNPFYTFYCFDNAFDVKARIRLAVRDWDRTFNVNSVGREIELISDFVNLGATQNLLSRQDNPLDYEIVGDIGAFNNFNDRKDWDDQIPMRRTAVPSNFVPGTTRWEPMDPFFSPTLFTNGAF